MRKLIDTLIPVAITLVILGVSGVLWFGFNVLAH